MPKPKLSKKQQQELAQERIKQLFQQAEKQFSEHPHLAHRYVQLARKIAMKVKTKIPLKLKRRFCKHCYHYLQPGVNSRTRIKGGKVIISCFECKKFTRILLK